MMLMTMKRSSNHRCDQIRATIISSITSCFHPQCNKIKRQMELVTCCFCAHVRTRKHSLKLVSQPQQSGAIAMTKSFGRAPAVRLCSAHLFSAMIAASLSVRSHHDIERFAYLFRRFANAI